MNILTDRLPTAAEIDRVEYQLNTDFKNCLKIILAFEDEELTDHEKQLIMLQLLYKEIPPDTQKACELAVRFLNCGEEAGDGAQGDAERLYSFEKDARYIFSAIRQSHNIDLETVEDLHWWKFCYLFMDLHEDCFFSKMIYYRRQRNRGKLTPEEREYCARIKDILDLPIRRSSEEAVKEAEFMRLLQGC